jgi:predicted metal-dependent phosphoesterase TrpH
MKADLHIHSTVSDGSFTIDDIVRKAAAKGLDAIAITDHDTLSHSSQIPLNAPLKVIVGIEMSAFDYEKGYRAHILGYNIKNPEIIEKLSAPIREARHINSLKQIAALNSNGLEIVIDRVKKADGKYIYKQHIMDYIVESGKCSEMFGEFYYKTFKNGGICDFDIRYLNPVEAVRAIKEAGGTAVLAHSGQQQNFYLIPLLVENGLDGLELNHHANSLKDMKVIKVYAEKYNLLLTGGSDFHGRYEANSPDIGDYLSEESGIAAICSGQS